MLNPLLELLTALKISYTVKFTQSATYYDHYITYFGPLPVGEYGQVGVAQYGGRLVPEATFKGNTTAWVQTIRSIRDLGPVNIAFVAADVSRFADYEKNGVVPAVSIICRNPLLAGCIPTYFHAVACRLGSRHPCVHHNPVVF